MQCICGTREGESVFVEFDLIGPELHGVRIGGNVAVRPESAKEMVLANIGKELEGYRMPAAVGALAARIRAAMPVDAELFGTSPWLIAEAICKAVADSFPPPETRIGTFTVAQVEALTEIWIKVPWRLIPEVPLSAAVNLALDEVLLDEVIAGRRPPTLRFWGWSESAIVVGRSQSVQREVDIEAARAEGIPIVRRISGGGTMFVQPEGAITYSLYLPDSLLPGLTIRQSYEVCDAWLVLALRDLGIDAHYVATNDIACADGKIGGAAQRRRGGGVLHHTTLAYAMDNERMLRFLRLGRGEGERENRGVASASKRVSPLNRQTGIGRGSIAVALFERFQSRFFGRIEILTADEIDNAENLVGLKYRTENWTNDIP